MESEGQANELTKEAIPVPLRPFCDECLRNNRNKPEGTVSCWECELYLCSDCVLGHSEHTLYRSPDGDNTSRAIYRDILREEDRRGRLLKEKIYLVDRVNVRHSRDYRKVCDINGLCVLQDGTLVVADRVSSCVKTVDKATRTVSRFIELSSPPWDITELVDTPETSSCDCTTGQTTRDCTTGPTTRDCTTGPTTRDCTTGQTSRDCTTGQTSPLNSDIADKNVISCNSQTSSPSLTTSIAGTETLDSTDTETTKPKQARLGITCPEVQKLLIVTLSDLGADITDTIRVNGQCRGLVYHNRQFITVCKQPDSVQIIDVTGETCKSITRDLDTRPLFTGTLDYLTLNPVNDEVFISCFLAESVKRFKKETCGGILSERDILQPKGLTVDTSGNVYVCSWKEIIKVTPDLLHSQTLLHNKECVIELPQAIVYAKGKLYISHGWSPTLKSTVTILRIE